MIDINSVKFIYGKERADHGLRIEIKGIKQSKLVNYYSLCLDVYGDVWRALPSWQASVAQLMLPYQMKYSEYEQTDRYENPNYSLNLKLGMQKLSHKTLNEKLDFLVQKGDPTFAIDVYQAHDSDNKLLMLYTKASLIKKSLQDTNFNAIYTGEKPVFKQRSQTFKYVRWWLCAFLYMLSILYFYLRPQEVLNMIPPIIKQSNESLISLIPPHPKSYSDAFMFGQLENQLTHAEQNNNMSAIQLILNQTSEIAGRLVNSDELHAVKQIIIDLEENKSLISKVYGALTFVNIIWLLAILGITISIGPFLYNLFKPLRKYLFEILKGIFQNIILPFINFLHTNGIIELFIYMACFLFTVEGYRMQKETGFYISFTGLLLQNFAFSYSTKVHATRINTRKYFDNISRVFCAWTTLCYIPQAIHYQSILIGYIVVILLYFNLGFSFFCFGLCYCIGFKEKNALQRCVVSSFIFIVAFIQIRILNLENIYIYPFQSAVTVFGGFVMYLGLLILSSKYYRDADQSYAFRNIIMIVALTIGINYGLIYNMQGLTNTAITYLVFYLIEKYTELHFNLEINGWAFIFIISVIAYKAALWFHQNPSFLVKMVQDIY